MTDFEQSWLTRRRALALGAGAAAALAGCVSAPDGSVAPGETPLPDEGADVATETAAGLDLPVDDAELTRGAARDAIPAIVDPVFDEDWSDVSIEILNRNDLTVEGEPTTQIIDPRLDDDDPVIGIARDGEARAYPFRILNWHEIVNDEFGGPLLVTYCPLCRSALTADRRVDGETTIFGVSGLLFRNALVMYDEATDSRWSQLVARAIQGPMTGESLDLEVATITSWGVWQEDHPETTVLRPPPESETVGQGEGVRDYSINPYSGYQAGDSIGLGGEFDDDRLEAKAEVIGIAHGDVARAYPAETIETEGVVEDTVDGLPVVVTTTADGTPVAWVREVDGETLSFTRAGANHLEAGDSLWTRTTGVAVDGPHQGTQLTQANAISPLFWFAWLDLHPDSELYSQSGGGRPP